MARTFWLHRADDGSGLGPVAEGVEWADGGVVIRRRGQRDSTEILPSIASVLAHDGRTRIVWDDDRHQDQPEQRRRAMAKLSDTIRHEVEEAANEIREAADRVAAEIREAASDAAREELERIRQFADRAKAAGRRVLDALNDDNDIDDIADPPDSKMI